jgi:hypothetical protein
MVQLQLSPASAPNWRGSFFTLRQCQGEKDIFLAINCSWFSRLAIFRKLVAGVIQAFRAVARRRRRGAGLEYQDRFTSCKEFARLWGNHLNRKLSRESWPIAVQPISFMSRSSSAFISSSARSTPAWPAAAKGKR